MSRKEAKKEAARVSRLITLAFDKISQEPSYSNAWICDETLVRTIRRRYPELSALAAGFDAARFNKAMKKQYGNLSWCYNSSNTHSVFSKPFKTACPYEEK